MLTAGQVLTLPVSQDECAGILLKSTVRKALRSVAAKLLLISLLIAVIGSFSSAAVQVRQVLCSDQGAILDPQLWQSDPWWFPTWESTQALHGFAPGLQESPGYRRPSSALYANEWVNEFRDEWMKNLKTNMDPQVLKSCLPMNDYMTVNMGTSHQEVMWPHRLLQLLPCLCFCLICKNACRWVHVSFFLSPAPSLLSLCNVFWVRLLNWVSFP